MDELFSVMHTELFCDSFVIVSVVRFGYDIAVDFYRAACHSLELQFYFVYCMRCYVLLYATLDILRAFVMHGSNDYVLLYTDDFAYRSNNFIVGLTNVSPVVSTPTLWNYTLCGQYPGAVPASATVSLYCPYNLPPFRYVIVQFPLTGLMSLCELEVIAPGT